MAVAVKRKLRDVISEEDHKEVDGSGDGSFSDGFSETLSLGRAVKRAKKAPVKHLAASNYQPTIVNRRPIDRLSVPITAPDGRKQYIVCREEEECCAFSSSSSDITTMMMKKNPTNSKSGPVMWPRGQSVRSVIEEIKRDQSQAAISQSLRRQSENKAPNQKGDGIDQSRRKKKTERILWVDKHQPKHFTDLLSSSEVNREVLSWLKSWDLIVYGHRYERRIHESNNRFNRSSKNGRRNLNGGGLLSSHHSSSNHNSHIQHLSSMPSFKPLMRRHRRAKHGSSLMNSDGDDNGRPSHPVLLLAGPPGCGKTTLTRVIAAHCGYRTVEINASDDRCAGKLRDLVLGAVEMSPLCSGVKRPPVIVLDEIDGALSIGASGSSSSGKTGSTVGGIETVVSLAQNGRLKRPMICICNDLYCRPLRTLRQFAKVVSLRSVDIRSLVKRLDRICHEEKVDATPKTLQQLAEITRCDVRLSLHTLQFLKERSGGGRRLMSRLTVDTLQRTPVGRKDCSHSLFEVWSSVLRTRKKKAFSFEPAHYRSGEGGTNGGGRLVLEKWDHICRMVHSGNADSSSDSMVCNGIFENYLTQLSEQSDPFLEESEQSADWLCYHDLLSQKVRQSQVFQLAGYLPYVFIAIHRLCADDSFRPLKFPTADFEAQKRRKESTLMIEQFLRPDLDLDPSSLINTTNLGGKKNMGDPGGGGGGGPRNDSALMTLRFARPLVRYFDACSAVADLIPFLLLIIGGGWAQKMKMMDHGRDRDDHLNSNTVGKGLFEGKQRRLYVSLMNTMIECGLRFKSEYGGARQSRWMLSPDLCQTQRFDFDARFMAYVQPHIRKIIESVMESVSLEKVPSHLKRQLAHDMNVECMRRAERLAMMQASTKHMSSQDGGESEMDCPMSPSSMTPSEYPTTPFFDHRKSASVSNASGPPSSMKKPRFETPCGEGMFGAKKRYSGSIRTPTPNKGNFLRRKVKTEQHRVFYPINFKFVEGYTNAVKRKVTIQDWL